MHDADIRAAVVSELNSLYIGDPNTRIVEEMGLWSGTVRIDIAVINGEMHGFELKSARDNLLRLPTQADLYNQVFDRVTLVTAERHVENVTEQVPTWWGLTVAIHGGSGLDLHRIRPATLNDELNPVQIARLLWRSEALAILQSYGIDRGVRSHTVECMVERLSKYLPLDELASEVRKTLKMRVGWLGEPVSD